MVEFALSTDGRTSLWLVEAKSSVPSSQNSPAKYEEYFKDIEEKMVNAVTMLMMGGIQRDKQVYAEFPDTIKQIDWSLVNLYLRLIITPVPKKFLPPLQDSLRIRLSRYLKLWGVNQMNLKVINGELAQQAPFNAEFVQ
ncbi:hypothetical protein AYI78_00575 [Shewanella algae]|nr:hypothetical protein AYI76_00575 [Shewanella algae]TVO89502.1 hypothetical protein AYI78_00575 [Shewanella algae]TVO99495.1 hypothetical protein AYI79_00575 [Shewanella algae]